MTVQKKAEKKEIEESLVDIESLILKGGSIAEEKESEKKMEKFRMHLNIPVEVVEKIDEARKKDFLSRTTWILQAIIEKLGNKNDD